jgi:hypothetical protein
MVVAFSEDEALYPSGPKMVSETVVWPGANSVLSTLDSFRPLFDSKLAEIPNSSKGNIYVVSDSHYRYISLCSFGIRDTQDWIASHGSRGPRHVTSWSATTLVHRANLYLLDALQYRSQESGTNQEDALQVSLPRVSPEFVAYNSLESAVEDGVLNVIGLDNSHPVSQDDFVPPETFSL